MPPWMQLKGWVPTPASGVYVYQLQAGPVILGRKMLLVK